MPAHSPPAPPPLMQCHPIAAPTPRVRARARSVRVTQIEALNGEFVALARTDEVARRLVSIPGIGVLNATALVAAIGDGAAFRRGRDLGA